MKQFFTIAIIILFSNMMQAQDKNDSFIALWKQVEQLEDKALTKSALKVVQSISEKAKKEKNSAQVVKALIYTSKYVMTLEEDAQLKIVNAFKTEIEKAPFPTKNVLESYLANLYWQYFQQNRYKFYNRTKTETKVDPSDFRTWDLTTIFQEITLHFEQSLENESGLRNSSVADFEPILNKQKGSSAYRPALLDLLGHAALDFYKTSENNITRPADKFEINDPELLCEAVPFLNRKITTIDQTSLQAKALYLYQMLLNSHVPDADNTAFIEIDIERLQYIYQNATFTNKDQHYLEVLNNAAAAKKGSSAEGLYRYQIAVLYQQQGTGYNAKTNKEVRWKLKEALQICEELIATYPNSKASEKCKALKSQLLDKNLYLNTERHIPLNKEGRLLVNYKNYNSLQLSAYLVSLEQLEKLEKLYEKPQKLAFIEKLPLVTEWKATLKNEGDYQSHTTEVGVPPLVNGHYLLLAKPFGETKTGANGTFAYSPVQVTDLTIFETKTNTHHQFQIVDRNNGSPISGASVKIRYQVNYDRGFLEKTMSSDQNGMVRVPLSKQYWNNVTLTITNNKEVAHFGEFYINQKYDQDKAYSDQVAFLFTDRSIYRPGQPLYFKGIAVARSEARSLVLANTSVSVILKDVNYQEVSRQEFKTNEYGSFSGEFILPSNGLTGNFVLEAQGAKNTLRGSTSFSVEEYKRPKFDTSFGPVTETYKVNDQITVKGNALAYAGSAITDAKVSYTVRRVVNYPRWYYWYRPYYNSTPQEIAHGETTTDSSGNYEINFKALPDNGTAKKDLPVFNYEVTADVTDINGETHSATTTVRVGYHSITATIYIGNMIDKDAIETKLSISTSNLNGQFTPAKGTLKMYKLIAPEYVLRNRPWPAPDYEGFTKETFKKSYPHDAYGNEHDSSQWEKGGLVWESQFDTGKSTEITFDNLKKWRSGKYIIELETKDKFGQLVKDIAQTTLFSDKDKTLSDKQLFLAKTDKGSYTVGDKAKVTLASSAEDVTVTVFVEKKNKIVETRIVKLNNNSSSFSIPITKEDEGGFGISYSFTIYNSYQVGSVPISVPYPQKDLEIETLTFRDKLQPGTDETWSFKIKGTKGEKVAAELLASMYDASLDSFRGHYWSFDPVYRPYYYTNLYIQGQHGFGTDSFNVHYGDRNLYSYRTQYFDSFNWFGFYFGQGGLYGGRMRKMARASAPQASMEMNEMAMDAEESVDDAVGGMASGIVAKEQALSPGNKADKDEENQDSEKDGAAKDVDPVKIRKNLQESAFFFPQLQTDKEGDISFSFTTPEALTRWNLQLLAHTKTLESRYRTLQTVTQKELMVIPNAPRFLRQGDEIVISTKVANLTDKKLQGQAKLELINAVSGKAVTSKLLMTQNEPQNFIVDSLGNTQVSWRLKISEDVQAVQYKVVAKAGDYSDGEQNLLPVLTNRMLVTETLPMWVRSDQRKTFVLDKLKAYTSKTLKHHKLSLEITSNPAWYAVQALPYLMEYPHECSEQLFSRYYANSLASHIANGNPRIQEVFDQWRNSDALLSNLEKNQELKSLLIQETPWLRDAQSETEQKKRIALLFNLDKMKNEQANALRKLQSNQKSNGAWSWFTGGPDNRFITQHIASGMGHLKKLSVTSNLNKDQEQMLKRAVAYLDQEFLKEYDLMKRNTSNINNDHLSQTQIHYLYMRSFFKDFKTSARVAKITAYYKGQAQQYWMNKTLYSKGMLALILHRMNDSKTADLVVQSLEENSINSEELGMYWKENMASWYWYQAPIETQALLIEAFSEIQDNIETIDNLKIWLLKNKQTNKWSTTKATTEAVYALLLQGNDWLSVSEAVEVLVGGEKITPSKLENVKIEAGTGYYKTSWAGNEINPAMAEVQLDKKGEGIAWGALYWQYFEDLDKISGAETPLKLKKKLFIKTNTATGEEIKEITDKTTVHVGDLIRVRIELRADRTMEFVHMKDMRAAGFEPINVISKYKWQDGLGYYESTKDASTNFFFDYLPKGVYVFEYDVRANNAGEFSNGITTIQSMYAPEFSSHSEGVRVAISDLN